jgi:hypothetical protein
MSGQSNLSKHANNNDKERQHTIALQTKQSPCLKQCGTATALYLSESHNYFRPLVLQTHAVHETTQHSRGSTHPAHNGVHVREAHDPAFLLTCRLRSEVPRRLDSVVEL